VKLYYYIDFFSKFEGLPSREEHIKTDFSILTTIVEFAGRVKKNPVNDRLRTFDLMKPQAAL
jgi:hypothetical protein